MKPPSGLNLHPSTKTLTATAGILSSNFSSTSNATAGTLSSIFSGTVDLSSVSSWNSQISDLSRSGDSKSSLLAFSSLRRLLLTPDRSSFPPAISAAGDLAAHLAGRQLHLLSLLLGLHPDLFISSSLVHMYSKCRRPLDARKAFDESPQPNSVLWTAIISCYAANNSSHIAISMFRAFLAELGPEEVDSAAAVSAISASARLMEKSAVLGLHDLVLKLGLRDVGVWNTLVDAYAKSGDLGLARKVFDDMSERDVVSWNSMIAVYGQGGLSAEALGLYTDMARGGTVRGNAVTLSASLLACAHAGALQIGKFIHGQASGLRVSLCCVYAVLSCV